MSKKITFRLSDNEYDKIEHFAKNYYKNNISKTIRVIVIRYMEIFNDTFKKVDELPNN